jgi:general secretion pathway protein I
MRNVELAGIVRARAMQGFTLLEVLVALAIVGTAFGACLSAMGNLTRNNDAIRLATLALWSAENRFAHIRIDNEWPALGTNTFDCSQDGIQFVCSEQVSATENPNFRRVDVKVFDGQDTSRRLARLIQVVPNAL